MTDYCYYYHYYPFCITDIESSLRPPHLQFESYKKILYFNNYFHLEDWR